MTLDERIEIFKRLFSRPLEGEAWMIMTQLVYDLIDDREILLGELGIMMDTRRGVSEEKE